MGGVSGRETAASNLNRRGRTPLLRKRFGEIVGFYDETAA